MTFSVAVITPPASALITLADAKAHLLVDSPDQDGYISSLIAAATGAIDAPSWLGRALITQTLELTVSGYEADFWQLPYRPIQSIVSVKYTDTDGIEQTLDASNYSLTASSILFTNNRPWAATCGRGFRIRYVAGYGDTASDVPAPIKHAVKLLIGHLFRTREIVSDVQPYEVPQAFEALLLPYRVYA